MEPQNYLLGCHLEDGCEAAASFADENDRDGCDISLVMYRSNLGPITREVWERTVAKFRGVILYKP